MCKGSQTTTQQSASAPDPQAYSMYSDLLKRAQGVAGQPYTPYGGELVAPNNAQQMSGVANINAMQGYYPLALGMQYNAAQPVSTQQIEQYQNPFTKDVVNATQAQFANQNQQQLEALRGRSISQGALGGNRQGIAEAELANQQNLAQSPVIANLTSQGYLTGLNTALTEQQAASQGAYGIANLANAGLTGANAQVGAGSLLQSTQQAQDAANYQQYLTALGYPFQTTQWLAGLGTGVGSQMGGTNSGSTTGPAPSMLGQLMGGAAGGAGILGSTGAFGSAGWLALAGLKRGGRVHGYADGGVANLDLGDDAGDGAGSGPLPESDATLRAQQRQLLTGDRRAQMFPSGTPELDLPQGMARTQTQNGVFHYNPSQLSADTIHDLSGQDRENELLDLGPVSKREVMQRVARGEHPLAVVERDPDGNEVRTAAGTNVTAPAQLAAMHRTKSHGHSVRIENPHAVLAQRLHARGHIPHRDMGGSVMPYAGGKSWIPTSGITPGHGAQGMSAPQLHSPDGGFDINKQAKNIGYLADAMKGFGNNGLGDINDPSWTGGTPLEGGAPIGGVGGGIGSARRGGAIRRRGGMVGVANGYAGGGAPDNAIVFDPDFAGAPADQFMPVGVAPSAVVFDRPTSANHLVSFDNNSAGTLPSEHFVASHGLADSDVSERAGSDHNSFAEPPAPHDATPSGISSPNAWYSGAQSNPDFAQRFAAVPPDAAPIDLANRSLHEFGAAQAPTGVAPPLSPQPVPAQDNNSTLSELGDDADNVLPRPRPHVAGQAGQGVASPQVGATPISRSAYAQEILFAADKYGIPPNLALHLVNQESGFKQIDPRTGKVLTSGAGAIGLTQLMPGTAHDLGVDPYNAYQNIHGGMRYLSQMYAKYGDWPTALAAYNAGPKRVDAVLAGKSSLPTETRNYVASVMGGGKMALPTSDDNSDERALALTGGSANDASARDGLPPSAHPVQYSPSGVANASGIDLGANSKLWPALMSAGFGMMASRSPFPGVALGEGAASGLQTYSGMKQQEQEHALSQQKVNLEAQKLSQQADRWQKEYEQKMLPYQGKMTAKEQGDLAFKGAQIEETRRSHDLQLRTPVVIGEDSISQAKRYALPRATDHGVEFYPIDPKTGAVSGTPMASPSLSDGHDAGQPKQQTTDAVFRPVADEREEAIQAAPSPEIRAAAPPASNEARNDAYLAYLAKQNPQYAATIKKMADYQMNPAALFSLRGNARSRAMGDLALYDPTYDQRRYSQTNRAISGWAQSPEGRATRSLSVTVEHMDTLENLADALKNGNVQALNSIRNVFRTQFGQDVVPNFNAAKQIVADEIAKAVIGGQNAESDRRGLQDQLKAASGPDQLKGVLNTFRELMGGQIIGLQHTYETATGLHNFGQWLTPHANDVVNRMVAERNHRLQGTSFNNPVPAPSAAQPGSAPKPPVLTAQDQAALDWASANQSDPRAAAIKKRLGVP